MIDQINPVDHKQGEPRLFTPKQLKVRVPHDLVLSGHLNSVQGMRVDASSLGVFFHSQIGVERRNGSLGHLKSIKIYNGDPRQQLVQQVPYRPHSTSTPVKTIAGLPDLRPALPRQTTALPIWIQATTIYQDRSRAKRVNRREKASDSSRPLKSLNNDPLTICATPPNHYFPQLVSSNRGVA